MNRGGSWNNEAGNTRASNRNRNDPGNRNDAEGASISFSVVGSDPDGDTLTWTATGLPDGLTMDSGSGVVTFRQRVDDPKIIKRYRDVIKRLRPLGDEE